ncbi:MAG: hypothetical protein RL177_1141, partial [Bacteroidota bacterium]
ITVDMLLTYGADVNLRDNRGTNAIYWAVVNGHTDIVKRLLVANADIHVIDDRGWTVLDHAKASHHEKITALLEQQTVS